METLRKILQQYSGPSVTLGSGKRGDDAAEKIDRAALQQALTKLSSKNEKYFIVGMAMAVVLFIALIVVAFIQIGGPNYVRAAPPIFGSSAALVVWRMFKTWREKSYTDCVLALVPNVDNETLKAIIAVLVKKL
jgi:hypothetical protein